MNGPVKILIIDDDPDVCFATSRIVKKAGYEVYEAFSGTECLQSVKVNKPDLVLLDVVLPDADGNDICRKIKDDPELIGTFIVMISALKTSSFEQAQGLDIGADGYIARPISNRELKARIDAMVRIMRAERERDQVIAELRQALTEIKRLSGLLPICMFCKKIRDDKGYWNRLEDYIQERSEADFSHSICDECIEKHYPEEVDK
jgi:DNA-binding response OmpR family regulator